MPTSNYVLMRLIGVVRENAAANIWQNVGKQKEKMNDEKSKNQIRGGIEIVQRLRPISFGGVDSP